MNIEIREVVGPYALPLDADGKPRSGSDLLVYYTDEVDGPGDTMRVRVDVAPDKLASTDRAQLKRKIEAVVTARRERHPLEGATL